MESKNAIIKHVDDDGRDETGLQTYQNPGQNLDLIKIWAWVFLFEG